MNTTILAITDDEVRAIVRRLKARNERNRQAAESPYFGTPITAAMQADVIKRCQPAIERYQRVMRDLAEREAGIA